MIEKLKKYFSDKDYDFVLLFGSFSNHSDTPLSDVDIALYKKDLPLKRLGYDNAMLESLLNKKVDTLSLYNLPNIDPLLAFNILDNHTIINIKNEDSYITFKTQAQLSYLEHKPLIDLNIQDLKERINNESFAKRNYA